MSHRDTIKIYRINTGSCGGCDAELAAAVATGALEWAASPAMADVLVLTGPLLLATREAFDLARTAAGAKPLVAVGRCAIDGRPFGRGGLAEHPHIAAARKLDGCPPAPDAIVEALRKVLAGEN